MTRGSPHPYSHGQGRQDLLDSMSMRYSRHRRPRASRFRLLAVSLFCAIASSVFTSMWTLRRAPAGGAAAPTAEPAAAPDGWMQVEETRWGPEKKAGLRIEGGETAQAVAADLINTHVPKVTRRRLLDELLGQGGHGRLRPESRESVVLDGLSNAQASRCCL